MKRKKKLLLLFSSLIAVLVISGFALKNHVQAQTKELFRMNKTLQEEGYYMAEFEFRMMSVLYDLDKGKYIRALSALSDYHTKLCKKAGLFKFPEFKNNQEEIDFYLHLQDSLTGAFVDSEAPFFIYWPITENVLNHIEDLQDSTTAPLRLKYPLKFLNKINTPGKLETHLNDLVYVGWLAPKFPMTPFIFARELMSCAREDNVLERNNLYRFSPEWKRAFTKWMYEFQDSETGMWGPKYQNTKDLAVKDLDNTASLLKHFRDKNGDNLYADFPLRHKEELFKSTLAALKKPFPDNDDLGNIHAWNLKASKGMKMLLRYLWKDASEANKKEAQAVFASIVQIEFEKYYVKREGAFSYYPNAEHASCDGMTNFSLDDIGALSYEKQKKYWGDPEKNALDLGTVSITNDENSVFDFLDTLTTINSTRIYNSRPNFLSLTDSVWAVIYPRPTEVLDIMEIVPNIVAWTETSTLSMGNWTSMAAIKNQYSTIPIKKPLIFKNGFPYSEVNDLLRNSSEVYFVGYDVLQIPRFVKKFKYVHPLRAGSN